MTKEQHPITPPPELVEQLRNSSGTWLKQITNAYQAGADQELEACVEWFSAFYCMETWMQKDLEEFRVARRPKPPSLKEQALKAAHIELMAGGKNADLIIRALETLPND